MIQPPMPYCGRRTLGGAELLVDHELLDRARGAAPRLRPVRERVPGVEEGAELVGFGQAAVRLDERPHLGAVGLGLRRELDRVRADDALRRPAA